MRAIPPQRVPALPRRHHGDDGVAALELALVLPVLLALAMGAIDFALAYRQQVMLRNAASNAASYAAVQPCDLTGTTGITYRATDEVSHETSMQPGDITVSDSFADATGVAVTGSTACTTAYQVTVTVTAPYQLITGAVLGILPFDVPQTLTVQGQETVRIEGR